MVLFVCNVVVAHENIFELSTPQSFLESSPVAGVLVKVCCLLWHLPCPHGIGFESHLTYVSCMVVDLLKLCLVYERLFSFSLICYI